MHRDHLTDAAFVLCGLVCLLLVAIGGVLLCEGCPRVGGELLALGLVGTGWLVWPWN